MSCVCKKAQNRQISARMNGKSVLLRNFHGYLGIFSDSIVLSGNILTVNCL